MKMNRNYSEYTSYEETRIDLYCRDQRIYRETNWSNGYNYYRHEEIDVYMNRHSVGLASIFCNF